MIGETKELTLPVRTLISVGDVSMSIPMFLCFCLFSYAWQKGRKLVGGGGGGGREGGGGGMVALVEVMVALLLQLLHVSSGIKMKRDMFKWLFFGRQRFSLPPRENITRKSPVI